MINNMEEIELRYRRQAVDYADTVTVLNKLFHKVVRINLTEDTFEEIKVIEDEKSYSQGYSDKLSEWLRAFAEKGNVHGEDIEEYFNFCNIEALKKSLRYSHDNSVDNAGIKYRRKIKGQFRWVRMYVLPGTGYCDDNQVGIMFVSYIHEDYEKEEQIKRNLKEAYLAAESANAAKVDFLSRMSHDLRTPMNGIMGMTILALENIDDKEYLKSCLGKISSSSRHLMGIIDDILSMSSIESGKVSLSEESFSISNVLYDAISILSPQIEKKHHTINIKFGELIHKRVIGDEKRLQRALINIISNSVKYTKDNGLINIHLSETESVYNTSQKMGQYIFEISDNGIGMSKEFIERIYEPFERADEAVESGEIGTGLGMPITRSIVHLMNGEIRIESEPGKGSKITVMVSLKVDEEQTEEEQTKRDEINTMQKQIDLIKESDFSGKQFLLVEDNEVNLEIALAILKMTGASITVAHNGLEAVEIFKKSAENFFDIIFMDIKMPKMNGCEATKIIRNLERKDAVTTPVIAMTANVFAEDVCKAGEAGMNGHIAKPLNLKKLMDIITMFV